MVNGGYRTAEKFVVAWRDKRGVAVVPTILHAIAYATGQGTFTLHECPYADDFDIDGSEVVFYNNGVGIDGYEHDGTDYTFANMFAEKLIEKAFDYLSYSDKEDKEEYAECILEDLFKSGKVDVQEIVKNIKYIDFPDYLLVRKLAYIAQTKKDWRNIAEIVADMSTKAFEEFVDQMEDPDFFYGKDDFVEELKEIARGNNRSFAGSE